jgi:ribosome-associated protein
VVDHIEESLDKKGQSPARIEGYNVSEWVLMDYIDVIVHVFQPEARQYYDLERLWIDAPRIEFNEPAASAKETAAGESP